MTANFTIALIILTIQVILITVSIIQFRIGVPKITRYLASANLTVNLIGLYFTSQTIYWELTR